MTSIVIAEKEKQATKYREAVGNQYGQILHASGHILRLETPEEANSAWAHWGFDLLQPNGGFYKLKIDPTKKRLFDNIKTALQSADTVYLATDPDREGQGIGENILRFCNYKGKVMRVMCAAVDKKSLIDAFANAKSNEEYQNLYDAQVARAQGDQIVNLTLTRAATVALKPASMGKGALGIGRVKTPTMAIVCEREREISKFVVQDYYDLAIDVESDANSVTLYYRPKDEERIFDESIAKTLASSLVGQSSPIEVIRSEKKQAPPKLPDLPSLQRYGSRFNWSAKNTLELAQKLYDVYEVTTYPRSEVRYLPENEIEFAPRMKSAIESLPFIDVSYSGSEPVIRTGKTGHFSDKALEGASHHAIIPNFNTVDKWQSCYQSMNEDEKRMFEYVAQCYLAAVSPDRIYDHTSMTMIFDGKKFSVTGSVDIIVGWREVFGRSNEDEDDKNEDETNALPDIQNGAIGAVAKSDIQKKRTSPPPRYTEGSLITAMEQAWKWAKTDEAKARLKETAGIGMPSSRDAVITGLLKQQYFQVVEKNKLKATDLALGVYDILMDVAPELCDPASTAEMEFLLDSILTGKSNSKTAVDRLCARATTFIDAMKERGQSGDGALNIDIKRAPTPKMKSAARAKAERAGEKLPSGVLSDYHACSEYLSAGREKNEDGTLKPSEAQLAFAKKLSEGGAGDIPEDIKNNAKELSKWIDANKDKVVSPPTENQLKFAHEISGKIGEDIPKDVLLNAKKLSGWIDHNKNKVVSPPTEKMISFAKSISENKNVTIPEDVIDDRNKLSKWIDKHK